MGCFWPFSHILDYINRLIQIQTDSMSASNALITSFKSWCWKWWAFSSNWLHWKLSQFVYCSRRLPTSYWHLLFCFLTYGAYTSMWQYEVDFSIKYTLSTARWQPSKYRFLFDIACIGTFDYAPIIFWFCRSKSLLERDKDAQNPWSDSIECRFHDGVGGTSACRLHATYLTGNAN